MHRKTGGPPLQAIARLVTLYRSRTPINEWDTAAADDHILGTLIKDHHIRLRLALTLGRDARTWMGAPIIPAAAVAYLLLDNQSSVDEVRRFLAPGVSEFDASDEFIDKDDPRESLRRVMQLHDMSPDEHNEASAMGFILKAWQLWVGGVESRTVSWKPEDGMPRVAQWAAEIPQ